MTDHQYEHFKSLFEEELRVAELSAQSAQFWTLAQAAAWVMFRHTAVVARFMPPRADHWGAFLMYPRNWTHPPVQIKWHVLFRTLETGKLIATGCRALDGIREHVPAMSWLDLTPDVDAGPYIRLSTGAATQPWTNILVLRADVERLWDRVATPNGRAAYDKTWICDTYLALKVQHGSLSKNDLIVEVQLAYQEAFRGIEPPRPTIQRYVKGL